MTDRDIFNVPDRQPGESSESYRARVSEHVGVLLDHVVEKFAEQGQEPPEWIGALKALRDASTGGRDKSDAEIIRRLAEGEDPWLIDPEYGCTNPLTGYFPAAEVEAEKQRVAMTGKDT